jgi:hypothetical protein
MGFSLQNIRVAKFSVVAAKMESLSSLIIAATTAKEPFTSTSKFPFIQPATGGVQME